MTGAELERLRRRAQSTRIAVIGAGAAGLVAAREFAKLGFSVEVLEAADRPGGAIRGDELDGLRLDLGAESFATRGGHVRALVDELGLGGDVVEPGTGAGGAWLTGLPGGGAAPLPAGGVLGIPSSPFAPDVRRIIGRGAAWRAYLTDRFRPLLTIGHEQSLGRLVRSRLGDAVADRLVAPVTNGVYSADPDDIDPDLAVPGLNAALSQAGSLLAAVDAIQRERRAGGKAPGSAVQGIDGGIGRIVDALVADLAERGAILRTGHRVEALERVGDGWRVVVDGHDAPGAPVGDDAAGDGDDAAGDGADGDLPVAAEGDAGPEASDPADFDHVLVAADEDVARRLLAPHAPGLESAPARPGPAVAVVTLVVSSAELDASPRGTGVLTVPGSFRAKALTHATAKWGWLREAAGTGRHVVRVSFGAQGEPPATDGMTGEEAADLARAEAEAMLGVALPPESVRAHRIARFAQSQPAATRGRQETADAARARIAAVPGLGAAGAWLAGTGLAQVVPDALAEAERMRHLALWEGGDEER